MALNLLNQYQVVLDFVVLVHNFPFVTFQAVLALQIRHHTVYKLVIKQITQYQTQHYYFIRINYQKVTQNPYKYCEIYIFPYQNIPNYIIYQPNWSHLL
jgi:hypothetical protein